MKILDMPQGSEEWLNARMGLITASKFKDVMAKGKGKTRKSYMYQIAAEVITSMREESFTNGYMEWGTETEPQAREMYEFVSGNAVVEVGMIVNDENTIAASPDGLVGEEGTVEFKCPKTTTQIETFLSGKMPTGHAAQVQGQLWVSGREWCDFVSFDPRIDGEASYFCVRVERDVDAIAEIEEACDKFEIELTEMIQKLRGA